MSDILHAVKFVEFLQFLLHFLRGDGARRVRVDRGDDSGGFLGQGGIRGVLPPQVLLVYRVVIGGRLFQVVQVIAGDTEGPYQ